REHGVIAAVGACHDRARRAEIDAESHVGTSVGSDTARNPARRQRAAVSARVDLCTRVPIEEPEVTSRKSRTNRRTRHEAQEMKSPVGRSEAQEISDLRDGIPVAWRGA